MAHLFDIAKPVNGSNYVGGRRADSLTRYPDTPVFAGFNAPSRFEGDVFELEVDGHIPKDINGTFYRIQPDQRFPPIFEDDIHFNGDGAVSAFRIQNGHVDFKQRYVQTDRCKAETRQRQSLFGRYRNPFTDNEMVKGVIRTVSNTNIVFWRGVLLATKEDGPPFAMDPLTLETLGRYDFDGQVQTPTFTAHPKFDPVTGEMVCFAYEAGGDGHDGVCCHPIEDMPRASENLDGTTSFKADPKALSIGSCDVVVWTIDANGTKTEETWYKAPFCGMIHDCGLTENYLILPMTPLKCSVDRMKRGGHHFAWDPNEDQLYGIVPRRGGKPEDIVWLRADNGFHGHIAGAYENPDGHIVFDLTVADNNVFFFFPPDNAPAETIAKRNALQSPTHRWILDPSAKSNSRIVPSALYDPSISGEFSRIDDRFVTKRYSHFWQCQIDGSRPYDFAKCGPPAGGLFNCLAHFNWDASPPLKDVYFAGPTCTFQEPAFIPRNGTGPVEEGDGYLIVLMNHLDIHRNDILIFDALSLGKGPLATIRLPVKLRLGLHGNFVDHRDIEEWQRRRQQDPVRVAEKPLPWQVKFQKEHGLKSVDQSERVNGADTNGNHGL